MTMRFSVLGSGSKGNSVYIESGKTCLLIDNGFSGKELALRLEKIGRSLDSIDAACVTHEHGDHIAGLGVISRRCRIPLYGNVGTFRGAETRIGRPFKRVEFNTGDKIVIGDLEVHSFPVSHDTNDPVGFVVSDGKKYLGYCTDTGKVTKLIALRLARCHGLILEFNHNLEMLKKGPYSQALQQRVRSSHGHLSNEDAASLLKELGHPGLKHTVLAHLSEVNNTPQLAMEAALASVSCEYHSTLLLARQDRPTEILSL